MNQDQINMIVGIILMIMGLVYFHKSFMAGIQGKMYYWQGFLPFTLVSPWIVVMPPKENTLCKTKEGMWIHGLMGPIFFISGVIALSAGADLANLPGTKTTNWMFTYFLPDKTPLIVFDKQHYRMYFPAVVVTSKKLAKIFFNPNVHLNSQDDLTPFNK